MTKIVGHRGAAGLALENTLSSIKIARQYGVDAIEFDVRKTKDNQVVLCHDEHLARISLADTVLAEVDLEDIINIPLHGNNNVPLLEDAIEACGDTPIIIEIKESGMAQLVADIITAYPEKDISITTFVHEEAKALRQIMPDLFIYLAEHTKPIEVIAHARKIGAKGITLNAWLLNPLTYILVRRYGLKLMVYTVNSIFIARFMQRLYPRIMICTDRPDKFRKRRIWKQAKRFVQVAGRLPNKTIATK